jgi:hypothetical protein
VFYITSFFLFLFFFFFLFRITFQWHNLQTVEVGHYSVEVEVQTAYQIIKLGLAPSYLSLSVKNKVQQTEKGMEKCTHLCNLKLSTYLGNYKE